MFHLDNNSGIDVMPEIKQTLSRQAKWFTEGDVQTPPSYPGADWFNIVQAELLNVLSDGGITPDKSKLNQLSGAIKSIISKNQKTIKLNSSIDSTSETEAATPLAVKKTYDLAECSNTKIDDLKQKFTHSDEHHQTEMRSPSNKNQFLVRDDNVAGLYSLEKNDWTWAFLGGHLFKGSIDSSQITTFQNQSSNGFIKLHGGIIIQWLTATTDGWGALDVMLPIAFPSRLLSVFITEASSSDWAYDCLFSYGYSINNSNLSKIRVNSRSARNGGQVTNQSGRFSLLAIGY
jgi:hypothetical protein